MRVHLFPPSSRALGVVALKNHLAIDCELRPIDLGRGDPRAREYIALNPNPAWRDALAAKDAATSARFAT
jgi:glutathione S-transferase